MLGVWLQRARLCARFICVACILGVVAGAGAADAGSVAEVTAAHESPGVRSELANISERNGPFVGPATPSGAKWTLPKGARQIQADTTADSDTYALPNGHDLTRVFAGPVNYLSAEGQWQPLATKTPSNSSAEPNLAASPMFEGEERPLGSKPEAACTLASAEPTKSSCGPSLGAGYTTSTKATKRSLLEFTVPYDSESLTILNARLELDVTNSTTTTGVAMGLYRVTTPWTTSATWDTSNGTTAWKAAGGDYENNNEAAINPSVGTKTGWTYWNPTEMLQRWYNGAGAPSGQSDADLGFLLKDVSEGSTNNMITFADSEYENEPSLSYESVPRGVGDGSQYTVLSTQLTPTSTLGVNVASGNLSLQDTDLSIAGRGLSFASERIFNSLNAGPYGYGLAWSDSNSSYVHVYEDGNVSYTDGSGATYPFLKSESKFTTPADIRATMCTAGSPAPCPTTLPTGVKYQLIYSQSQTRINFGHESEEGFIYPTEVEDKNKNALTASYTSGIDEPTMWTDTEGRKIEYSETNPSEGYTKITDVSGGRSASFKYEGIEGFDELVKSTDADGHNTTYGYGPEVEANYVAKITDPDGHITLMEYEYEGRVTKITRVTNTEKDTGPTAIFTYYEPGKTPEFAKKTGLCGTTLKGTIVKDPDWTAVGAHETLYCSNSLDEVEKTFDAAGNETKAKYNPLGGLTSTTAASPGSGESGGVETLGYDSSNENLMCIIQGSAEGESCPTKSPSSKGVVTSFNYKDEVNPFSATQVESPEGSSTFVCYTHGKQKESEGPACPAAGTTEPTGSLQNESDQLALEKEVKTAKEKELTFTYDEHGEVKTSTEADGHATEYLYDEKGNLKEIKPPAPLVVTKITVDADSRPHIITNGANHIETITYDADDRITEIAYTGTGTAKTVKFEYDGDGNLTKREDSTGTTKYSVDALNRVTKEELPGSLSNSYEYDAASNMTKFTDGGGGTSYKYNGLNELESMTEPGESKATTFGYDNDHRLDRVTYPSGAIENYKLEATTGRPETITAEKITGTTVPTLTYTYKQGEDDTSLIQTLTESTGNTTTYSYDKLERLIEATTKGSTIKAHYAYKLDGAGNRTSQQVSTTAETGGTTTYDTLNGANELECRQTISGTCTVADELSAYTYDGAGEETAITPESETGGGTLAYNAASELSSLTPSGGSALALSYGGTGQDDLTTVGSATTLQNSLLGLTREVSSTGTSYYARTPNGLLIDERTPSGHYNPLYDSQGDVIALVSSTGKVERTFHYGPYGENIKSEGTQTIPYPFGYKGGYRMPAGSKGQGNVANSLVHFGERYYDPTTGRWTQQDPTSHLGSTTQGNSFSFAADDPINQSDPSGLSVGDYVKECAKGALTGGASEESVEGAVKGCVVGDLAQGAKELGCETCANVIKLADTAEDIDDLADEGGEGVEEVFE
jgi:RHS repeat-associated protein